MAQHPLQFLVLGLAASLLAGCAQDADTFVSNRATNTKRNHGFTSVAADPFAGKGSPIYNGGQIPFGGGNVQLGKPYQVAGRWFYPKDQPGYDKVGMASWYGADFNRRKTANGEWFDMETLTAAHPTLPLPSYAVVTNLENGRNVVVRVNDRGPFVGSRMVDLSKRAADTLGYRNKGKAKVRMRLLGPAPKQDSMAHVMAMNQAMIGGASMNQLAAMGGNNRFAATSQVALAEPPTTHTRRSPIQQASLGRPEIVADAFVVRVAVFHNLANANDALQRLSSFGPTKIVKAVGANGPLYRVEIGPIDNKADADAALTTAIGSGYEDAKLMQAEGAQVSLR